VFAAGLSRICCRLLADRVFAAGPTDRPRICLCGLVLACAGLFNINNDSSSDFSICLSGKSLELRFFVWEEHFHFGVKSIAMSVVNFLRNCHRRI
jgi:hypothetical protein